jgi:hypothetical protein
MMNLPLQLIYPTTEEITAHLAAGRYYGISSTCGKKIKHNFTSAMRAAYSINKQPDRTHFLEPYPCYFCSPDKEKGIYTWHIGRMMTYTEWEIFMDKGNQILEMEDNVLTGGVHIRTHPISQCEGRGIPCCIHNPSNHHMVTWPMNWRSDRRIMERMCIHGVNHRDPDDLAYNISIGNSVGGHGCCPEFCCQEGEK